MRKRLVASVVIVCLLTQPFAITEAGQSTKQKETLNFEPIVTSTINYVALEAAPKVLIAELVATPEPTPKPTPTPKPKQMLLDNNISWYGPGFYGHRTACGPILTKTLLGVAHKTLPCGTLVTFTWKSKTITVPVVDRGPYIPGRIFDLTGATCIYLNHCFTGKIYYRIGK